MSVTEISTQPQAIEGAILLPRGRVKPNPDSQQDWDAREVESLGKAIRILRELGGGIAGTGILYPIVIQWPAGSFTEDGQVRPDATAIIKAGELQWQSAEAAGFEPEDLLPVITTDSSGQGAPLASLIEAIHSNQIKPRELAQKLKDYSQEHGVSMRKLAAAIGKPLWWVQNHFDLLKVNDNVKRVFDDNTGGITAIQRISRIKSEKLQKLLVDLKVGGASFRSLSPLIRWDNLPDEIRDALIKRVEEEREALDGKPIDWKKFHIELTKFRENQTSNGTAQTNLELDLSAAFHQLKQTEEAMQEAAEIEAPAMCLDHLDAMEILIKNMRKTIKKRSGPVKA